MAINIKKKKKKVYLGWASNKKSSTRMCCIFAQ